MLGRRALQGVAWVTHPVSHILLPAPPQIPEMIAEVVASGGYERNEAEILLKLAQRGDRILELGGGLGFVSALMCKVKQPERYVVVEADRKLIPLIETTHRLNGLSKAELRWGLITADKEAIDRGIQRLALPENFLANSVFLTEMGHAEAEVPVLALDGLLTDVRADTLIVDIEGSEKGLFRGVDLSSVRLAVIEMHPALIGSDGVAEVVADLAAQGLNRNILYCRESVMAFERGQRQSGVGTTAGSP